jgi:hypothetical protein
MNDPEHPHFFFVTFPVYFVALWCAVCLVLSVSGGWRRLGERYAARDVPLGERFLMRSVGVGWVSYNNCLTFRRGHDGFYMSVWYIFRLGHPPLYIPWSDVQNIQTYRQLWVDVVKFDVGAPRVATVRMTKKMYDRLRAEGAAAGVT